MEEKLKVLDLFSGIGGFSYACEHLVGGFETVAFCEIDKFCQRVLRKNFPNTPIYKDVKELKNETNRFGRIDIVCGGFPCQPFSLASHNRKGTEDDRYLWGEMFEISKMVKADWIIGENVVGLQSMGLEQILLDLESEGYQSQVFNIPAPVEQIIKDKDYSLLPTPTAHLAQEGGYPADWNRNDCLTTRILALENLHLQTGKVKAEFIEEMMGYPKGWTQLDESD